MGLLVFAFLSFVIYSNEASAINITTQKFQFSRYLSDGSLAWSPDKYYNDLSSNYYGLDAYRIYWNPVSVTGNTSALHFETNIVFQQIGSLTGGYSLSNLTSFSVNSCNFNIVNQSVSTALTNWTSREGNSTLYNTTLTVYGDVTLNGLTNGQNTQIICIVGTAGKFYNFTGNSSHLPFIYFEQNPTNVLFSTNMDSSLLQTQIQQNSTIIQQNINTYDMVNDRFDLMSQQNINTYNMEEEKLNDIKDSIDNQSAKDKAEIQNASNNSQSSANSSGAQSQAQGQTLLQLISGFITAVSSPAGGNCRINMDLSGYAGGTNNTLDLCHLSPPAGITAVLSILLIVFVIRAVIKVVQAMIGLYREFQS